MTEKELLYLEDAVNHASDAKKICNYYASIIGNDLSSIITNYETEFNKIYQNLIGIIGG